MSRSVQKANHSTEARNGEMEISTIESVTPTKKVLKKTCKMNCFKLLLVIFNIAFILVGIALFAVGIWTAISKLYVSHVIGDTLFSAASYMLIGVGFVIICICIFGLLSAFKEKKRWLTVYFGFLIFGFLVLIVTAVLGIVFKGELIMFNSLCPIFGFLVLIVTAVLGIVFKGEVETVMVNRLRNSLIDGYGQDALITSSWDQLQTELECCAISETKLGDAVIFNFPYKDGTNPKNDAERGYQDSWPIYKRTQFYNRQLMIGGEGSRKYVPESCCVVDKKTRDYKNLKHCQFFSTGPPTNFETSFRNSYLFYQGCYEKSKELVLGQSDIIVALGFVFAFLMVAGMVVTFFLIRSFVDDEDDVKRRREPDNL